MQRSGAVFAKKAFPEAASWYNKFAKNVAKIKGYFTINDAKWHFFIAKIGLAELLLIKCKMGVFTLFFAYSYRLYLRYLA